MQKSSSALVFFGCTLLSMALGIGISLIFTNYFKLQPILIDSSNAVPSTGINLWYLRMLLHGVSHAFTFLLPAIFYWYFFESKSWVGFSRAQLQNVSSVWISLAIIVILIPVSQKVIGWNGNIWVPILAHVVNNGLFVLMFFIHQNWPSKSQYFEYLSSDLLPLMVSFILSIYMLFAFRKQNYVP